MSNYKVGDRVGAIQKCDTSTVYLYGYGVYDGDMEHPDIRCPNPRITLDNGKIIWGLACWWASEEDVKSIIGTREVVNVELS